MNLQYLFVSEYQKPLHCSLNNNNKRTILANGILDLSSASTVRFSYGSGYSLNPAAKCTYNVHIIYVKNSFK